MKVLEVIKTGSKLLKEKNISSHVLDTELLLSKSLNKSREELMINLDQNINKRDLTNFNKYLISRDGTVASTYGSKVKPDSIELTTKIEELL